MKKTTLLIIAGILAISPALAAQPQVYIAPEVGIISHSNDCDGCDATSFGFGIGGGINITDNLGIEVGYLRTSRNLESVDNSQYMGVSVSGTLDEVFSTFKVGGKVRINVSDEVNLVGRLGFHKWDLELDADGSVTGGSNTVPVSGSIDFVDGMNPYFGGGIQFQASDNIHIEAAITRYVMDDEVRVGGSSLKFDESATAFSAALLFEL